MLDELFKYDISLGVVREDVIINRDSLDNDLVLRLRLEVSIEYAQEKSAGMSHKLRQVWRLRKKDWDEDGTSFSSFMSFPTEVSSVMTWSITPEEEKVLNKFGIRQSFKYI